MTVITFGEGRRIPALGAAGASSHLIAAKVGRSELVRDGQTEVIRKNVIEVIKPGERFSNMNPGGGGYGDPADVPSRRSSKTYATGSFRRPARVRTMA